MSTHFTPTLSVWMEDQREIELAQCFGADCGKPNYLIYEIKSMPLPCLFLPILSSQIIRLGQSWWML